MIHHDALIATGEIDAVVEPKRCAGCGCFILGVVSHYDGKTWHEFCLDGYRKEVAIYNAMVDGEL